MAAFALTASPAVAQQPVPQGAEFQVNTTSAFSQINPSVARDADGDFVVVWEGFERVGPEPPLGEPGVYAYWIYGQRYATSGTPVGAEFHVNTSSASIRGAASVAMEADGDFVVAWQSFGQDGDGYGVYARRYVASGVPAGPEFLVNITTTDNQMNPSVAFDADGDFVVAWESDQDGSQSGIYARRYAASGAIVGGEFRVNTYTTGLQYVPSVAVDADGDFVVTWNSFGQDGSSVGVYAQRYAASGEAAGGEFRVNTTTTDQQGGGPVVMDADGDFVVAWTSYTQDGDSFGAYAQRYTASGVAVGGEFRVNTTTTGSQGSNSVAMDADGDFVVVWNGSGPGDTSGIYAQRYAASGEPVGSEFRVNTTTAFEQGRADVAVDADGDLVVVWQSNFQDGDGTGIYAQRYAAPTVASEDGPAAALALAVSPNPVGSSGGLVRYNLREAGSVRVSVVDVLGREAAVLWSGDQAAGPHRVALDTGRLAPGVYVVRVTAGPSTVVRRLTVAR